jgi:adenylate cyclase
MSDIFISYARSTAAKAQMVGEALRGLGYGVWRDDEIPAHRAYADVIQERLAAAKAVLVFWSSEAASSEWVRSEAERARAERKLVQLSVDRAPLPMPFDQIQCADLMGWSGDLEAPGWRKVVGSIAELVSRSTPAKGAAAATQKPISICVLPFANMSDDPQQEYFSDGVTEDIITDLSKVSALEITARNTAFGFKGKNPDIRDVARQVGVSYVLEGSVRKAGPRVRITAQLIDGASGNHLWAERYDRDLTDIFALQDEISEAIVAALKLKLLPEEKKAIEARGTASVDAYNLYLMARRQLLTGNAGDTRREESIIRFARRATEIDPGYARAWALMATAQAAQRFDRGKAAADDGLAAADRALQLDPSLAEPHAVKARVLGDRGQVEEAMVEIETGLRLDAECSDVHRAAAMIYYRQRRLDEAIAHFGKATDLEESDFGSPGMMVYLCTSKGDREGAARAARISLERAEKVIASDPNNGHAMAFGAGALSALGEIERAKEWMERALLVDPDNQLMRYNFACSLVVDFHALEAALEMLKPAMESVSSSLLSHAKIDVDLDPLRGDPRFQAMLDAAETRLKAAEAE